MKIFTKILFTFIFAFHCTFANAQQLSNDTQISLITCGAGEELYSVFGHSGIRVRSDSARIDMVFNYGTFDFRTEYFYVKFARGTLMYSLSVNDFDDFINIYKNENRDVYEQKLNLTIDKKNKLLELLKINYKPKNRYYRYDFFKDNCSTRIRDIFQKAVGAELNFSDASAQGNKTFRQLINPYLKKMAWSKFGIDILLGIPTDVRATNADYMFLPDELMKQTALANVNGRLFAQPAETIFRAKQSAVKTLPSPVLVFWLFFALIVAFSVFELYRKKYFKIFDRLFFLCLALLSVLIIVMWIFSLHYPVRGNLNVLWLNPLYLYVFIWLRKSAKIVLYIAVFCNLLVLLGWTWLPQQFNVAFIPIILTAILRLALMIKDLRIKN